MKTKERHAQTLKMVADYQRGDSSDTIAERYGMTGPAVLYRLKTHGVTMRPQGRPRKGGAA